LRPVTIAARSVPVAARSVAVAIRGSLTVTSTNSSCSFLLGHLAQGSLLDNPLEFERIGERQSRGSTVVVVVVVGAIVIAIAGTIVVSVAAKAGAIVIATIGAPVPADGTALAIDLLATTVIPTRIFGGSVVAVAVTVVAVIVIAVPLGRRACLDRATA
jgi:hypothetical protein